MATPDIKMWVEDIVVTLKIRDRIDGGIPASKDMIKGWVAANCKAMTEQDQEAIVNATLTDLPDIVEEVASSMYTVFKQDEVGPYYEGRCLKSALKEASNVLRDILIRASEKTADGEKKKSPKAAESYNALKSKAAEKVFVTDNKIYLMKEDDEGNLVNITRTPDMRNCDMKFEEKPIHVQTPQGKRDAIKRLDYAPEGTMLQFHLKVLNDGQFDKKLLGYLLEYMGEGGIGSNRSQGSGKFDVVHIGWPEKVKAEKAAPVQV